MTIQLDDVLKNVANMTDYDLERKVHELVAVNPKYYNFNNEKKHFITDFIKKYKSYIREYGGVSAHVINEYFYPLHQKRLEYKLTEEDLRELKEIFEYFEK